MQMSIAPSPWSDHLKIAIRTWSLNRARQMSAKAAQEVLNGNVEDFLVELLMDALLTFNEDYNRCYNEQIVRMEGLVRDAQMTKLPEPFVIPDTLPRNSYVEHLRHLRTGRMGLPLTPNQIKHMADRFLQWKLPENFNPDGGISFKKIFNEHTSHPMKHEPVGTNLFDVTQAEEMIRYMVEGMPDWLEEKL
jgi:hypothetical protein